MQIRDAEDDPRLRDDKEKVDVREHAVLFEKIADAEFFEQDERKQRHAPEDKVPARPVPQARKDPHDRERERGARPAVPAAAEGDVKVVAEPRAERDVPAAVKFAHRAGEVRQVKVARHGEPQHLTQAHGHERVAGKVEVEL